jgi:hypothetical protein
VLRAPSTATHSLSPGCLVSFLEKLVGAGGDDDQGYRSGGLVVNRWAFREILEGSLWFHNDDPPLVRGVSYRPASGPESGACGCVELRHRGASEYTVPVSRFNSSSAHPAVSIRVWSSPGVKETRIARREHPEDTHTSAHQGGGLGRI